MKRYLSATQIAKERGTTTAFVFQQLIQAGYINPVEGVKKWELTSAGETAGGRYSESKEFREYILWPSDLAFNEISKDQGMINSSPTLPDQDIADTEGEDFIKEYLNEVGIKYEYQVPIRDLTNDSKGYRVADFYLPKFGVYIEFLGHWNTNAGLRNMYKQKMTVYTQNRIPCVFIYPENLGTLHFTLDRRIIQALKDTYQEHSLKTYKHWKFKKSSPANWIGLLAGIIGLIYILKTVSPDKTGLYLFMLMIFYNSYYLLKLWHLIYHKERFNLNQMLNE